MAARLLIGRAPCSFLAVRLTTVSLDKSLNACHFLLGKYALRPPNVAYKNTKNSDQLLIVLVIFPENLSLIIRSIDLPLDCIFIYF